MLHAKAAPRPPQFSHRIARVLAAGFLAASASVALVPAQAQDHAGPGMQGPGMRGPGMEGPRDDGPMMFAGPPERVARAMDRMLDGLGASDAQRTQIRQIAMAAASDLRSQRDAGRGMREKAMQLFTAPTVDAGAVEALRQQGMALHDQASKRVTQAMLDIAKVLTPEQRAKIGDRIKQRQDIMRDRMRRMQQERAQRQMPPPAPK